MTLVDHHDIATRGGPSSDLAGGNLVRTLCRLLCAMPFAMMVATAAGPGSAFAQCATANTVLSKADRGTEKAAVAVQPAEDGRRRRLAQREPPDRQQYLSQRYTGAENRLFNGSGRSADPANILLRAFPGNPNFLYNSAGLPTAPVLPASIIAAVEAITFNSQLNTIKPISASRPTSMGMPMVCCRGRPTVMAIRRRIRCPPRSMTIPSRQPTRPLLPRRTSKRPTPLG